MSARHFQERNYVFNRHATLIIIDQLTNITKSKDILRKRFIDIKIFSIKKMQTLHPQELNQEFNT